MTRREQIEFSPESIEDIEHRIERYRYNKGRLIFDRRIKTLPADPGQSLVRAAIEAGMDKYAVLLFRNQDITDEQQLAFALNFGEREKARGGNQPRKALRGVHTQEDTTVPGCNPSLSGGDEPLPYNR